MVNTFAALKAGFSIVVLHLVDYEFTANKNMQLNLFVYTAGSFIGKRFVYLRAAGTNHILTQWLLFWWLITAQ